MPVVQWFNTHAYGGTLTMNLSFQSRTPDSGVKERVTKTDALFISGTQQQRDEQCASPARQMWTDRPTDVHRDGQTDRDRHAHTRTETDVRTHGQRQTCAHTDRQTETAARTDGRTDRQKQMTARTTDRNRRAHGQTDRNRCAHGRTDRNGRAHGRTNQMCIDTDQM